MDQEEMLAQLEAKLDEKYGERIQKLEFELERARAYQEIMNLMGRYAFLHSGEEHVATLDCFAMDRDDTSVEIGPYGVYLGGDGVKRCYVNGETALDGDRLGHMCEHHIDTAVVEIAADGKTAKGLWALRGSYTDLTTQGTVSYWVWGYMAADFVWEEDAWKLWHLQELYDVHNPCGTSWARGESKTDFPEVPELAPIAAFRLPEPTVKRRVREIYTVDRPFTPAPRLPEPYETFGETFTYGLEGGM